MKKSLTPITVSPSICAWPLNGATRRMARGFDDPQKRRFQGEGPRLARRRASTDLRVPIEALIHARCVRLWGSEW
jgi:hypothetical protein